MNKKTVFKLLPLSFLISTALQAADIFDPEEFLPKGTNIYNTSETQIGEESYQFVKFLNQKTGLTESVVFNEKGMVVKESDIPVVMPSLITVELMKKMATTSKLIKVNVALKVPFTDSSNGKPEVFQADVQDGIATVTSDGKRLYEEDVLEGLNIKSDLLLEADLKRREARMEVAKDLIERNNWDHTEELENQLKDGLATLTLELKPNQIEELEQGSVDLIDGIELYIESKDDMADALISTRVDPHALQHISRRGRDIGVYLTEVNCPDNGHISRYKKLKNHHTQSKWHAEFTTAILRQVSPESFIYCRDYSKLPKTSDLSGSNGNPRLHIISRSNAQPGHNYTTQDRNWDDFIVENKLLAFNSAGNSGKKLNQDEYKEKYNKESNADYTNYLDNIWAQIGSPAKGLNIVAVGSYNDRNNTISDFSSYKNPQTKNQKPEVLAPGQYITVEVMDKIENATGPDDTRVKTYGGGGTSMAAPVAAGFSANLLSTYPWLRLKPALSKALMMSGATRDIAGQAGRAEVGGIDFYRSVYNFTTTSWRGKNSNFFNKNGNIERKVRLTANRDVRIVISWLNRGTYTYNNRTAAHPIGMDLDMSILDSNGKVVASSMSWDNSYEMINFTPKKTGIYTVKIHRFANRDKNSRVELGLSINW